MEKHQQYGQMIKYFRQQKRMTQDELAVGICTSSYLSRIENGLVVAEQPVYDLLFERLNLNFEQFVVEQQKQQQFLYEFYEALLSNEIILPEQSNALQHLNKSKRYPILKIQIQLIYARYLLSEQSFEAANAILTSLEKVIVHGPTREWQLFVAIKAYAELIEEKYGSILKREQETNSMHLFTSSFECANYLYHLAFASHRAYRFTLAQRFIVKAKQTFTHLYKPLFQLKLYSMHGVIYNALGQFNEAITEYEAGIQLLKHVPSIATDLQWASIYNNLAFTYESMGDFKLAGDYYQQSLNHLPDLHTQVNYCRTLLFAGKTNELTKQLQIPLLQKVEPNTHHYHQLKLIASLQSNLQATESFFQVERNAMKYFTGHGHIELILSYGPHVARICEAHHQYKRATELYKLLFETSEKMRIRIERGELTL